MKTPVLFLTFNRPDKTARVFDMIKEVKPERLYLASDGPRRDRPTEGDLILETRKILSEIDWPCEVHKLYRDENLGCKKAVSSAIQWFFEHEEMGIILEDDCLPNTTFFDFATQMLQKYKDDEKVLHINGSNFLPESEKNALQDIFYFSKNVHVWGWASWKRAWKNYDVNMSDLDNTLTSDKIKSQFRDKKIGDFWISLFKHIRNKNIDTWDAQWAYAVLKSEGLCVTPARNLIENIGFESDSTHTSKNSDLLHMARERETLSLLPLIYPTTDQGTHPVREDLDEIVSYNIYIKSFWQKVWAKIKSVI